MMELAGRLLTTRTPTTDSHAHIPIHTYDLSSEQAQRELNETFSGGCGSYLLQLMIISFLQHQRKEAEQVGRQARVCVRALVLFLSPLFVSSGLAPTHACILPHPQHHPPKKSSPTTTPPQTKQDGAARTWNLGSLFLGFLRLYGVDFNYEETGVSVLSEGA